MTEVTPSRTAQFAALARFDESYIGLSKGSLSLALILTRNAKAKSFPLAKSDFVTGAGGQVAGLGGGAVKKILADFGIERILSSEGGRTSRGNMERMEAYVGLLNTLHGSGELDLDEAEKFWVARVVTFFDALPFLFKLDPARSLRASLRDLLAQAVERQREVKGTMYAGAVMQHLVGAALDLAIGGLKHHGFAVADAPSARSGDFLLGDVAIHVTTAPGEALIGKCASNLSAGLRPMIITTEDGVGGAKALARQFGIDERLDVVEIEQFLAMGLYERGQFEREKRSAAVTELVERYNEIIAGCETDPSLRIAFEGLG